jgi:hypothetical protein
MTKFKLKNKTTTKTAGFLLNRKYSAVYIRMWALFVGFVQTPLNLCI